MPDYATDRGWSDRFLPEVRQLIAPHLIGPASEEMDQKQATDLVILRARDLNVAVRVRRPGFLAKYPDQFTIRSHRDSNVKTELQKIVEGFGDLLFYGHANEDEKTLDAWYLVNLAAFRAALIRKQPWAKQEQQSWSQGQISNGDGTCFAWFDVKSAPSGVVIASSKKLVVA